MSVDTKSEACTSCSDAQRAEYDRIRHILDATPCFGNDIDEVDMCARKATQVYSHEVEKYKNPRGGQYQAGCYPVSANVLFGKDVQALPDDVIATHLLQMVFPLVRVMTLRDLQLQVTP